jgi:LmbE family N-acetylglucosaminyl deacetylase
MLPATVGKLTVVSDVPERAMVVFAHPDDAEIGSGGVVARWADAGCEVTYVLCTSGNSGTADRTLSPARLAKKRAAEQKAAAESLGVKNVAMLGYPDGGLEDTREFRGDIVRAIRKFKPAIVFTHDPHRMKSFQHRDHRMVGTATMDAIYPYARDHLHYPEHIEKEGFEPHKVKELWFWGADEPNIIVDISPTIQRQIEALQRHESQVPGLSVEPGQTVDERVRARSSELARGYPFKYGEAFRRIIARR